MDIDLYGLSADALTNSSRITKKRRKRQKRAPNARQRTLDLALEGKLGAIHPAWHGFIIRDGQSWTVFQLFPKWSLGTTKATVRMVMMIGRHWQGQSF